MDGYGLEERDISEKRESLKLVKKDLRRLLKPKRMINVGDVFILSDVESASMFVSNVLVAHVNGLQYRTPVDFSVLVLKQGLFVGKEEYALGLKLSFGGEVHRTGHSHIVEWLWEGKRKIGPIKAFKAIFNMV